MNAKDLKDPHLAYLALHRPTLAKHLRRNNRTGCLEYKGPPGHVRGNPLVLNLDGEAHILLRRWVYVKHYGKIPKGYFPWMKKCENPICHEYRHMALRNFYGPYSPSPREYSQRFSRDKLIAIRHYGSKVPKVVVAKAFRIERIVVVGICKSNLSSSVPPGWRPPAALEKRVEMASIISRGMHFYLSPETRVAAMSDIQNSELSAFEKDLVIQYVKGVPIKKLLGRVRMSRNGSMYQLRRCLVKLSSELGKRRWIYLCSKGQINKWKVTIY